MAHWELRATYADGTEIEKNEPYRENGNILAENNRIYDPECWLLEAHEDCTWYSVNCALDEDDEDTYHQGEEWFF